jgi:DNA-binding CsgD family transcriptional regulator
MNLWRETCLDAFATAKSDIEVFHVLSKSVRDLGFEHCSFGVRLPLPLERPKFSLQSDYPDEWVNRYISQNYFTVDPTVKHGLTQTHPMIWQASNQKQSVDFWEEASSYGLRHGWCMPTSSRSGTIGLITMVRSGEPIGELELAEKEFRMTWLVEVANGAMNAHLLAHWVPEYNAELTSRERDVLRWSSAGRTYSEIGKILSVDQRTVKFHLVNAMRKLNAANKTEAAVKGALLGLL